MDRLVQTVSLKLSRALSSFAVRQTEERNRWGDVKAQQVPCFTSH